MRGQIGVSAFLAAALGPAWAPGVTPALGQGAAAAESAEDATRAVRMEQRDRLWDEAQRHADAGDHEAAIAAAQQIVAMENELFGPIRAEAAYCYGWIGDQQFAAEDYDAAAGSYDQKAAVLAALPGVPPWLLVNARQSAAKARLWSGFDATARQQLATAEALEREFFAHFNAGEHAAAVAAAEQALALRRERLGEDHPNTVELLVNLAATYASMGEYERAQSLQEKALAASQAAFGEKHPFTATAHLNLARCYQLMGDAASAVPLLQRALDIRMEVLGDGHPDTLTLLDDLAVLHIELGDLGRALPLCEQAAAIRTKVLGEEHPDTAKSLQDAALLCSTMGEHSRAIEFFEKALAITKRLRGADHPETAGILAQLGSSYESLSEYEHALPLAEQALAIRKNALGMEHPETAESMQLLARIHYWKSDYARAVSLYEQALAIRRHVFGEEHPETAASLSDLSAPYFGLGEYDRAASLLEDSLAMTRRTLGDKHPQTATALSNLAAAYLQMGEYSRALPLSEQSVAIRREVLGDEHRVTAVSVDNLAGLYYEMGDLERALPAYEEALAIRRKVLGEEHAETATSFNNLARGYSALGDYARAIPLYERALRIQRKLLGDEHPTTAMTLDNVAALYARMGDYDRALALNKKALAIFEKTHGDQHADTAISLNQIAGIYVVTGEYGRAFPLFAEALAIRRQILGDAHRDTAISLDNMALVQAAMDRLPQAAESLLASAAVSRKSLERELFTLSDHQIRAMLDLSTPGVDRLASLPLKELGLEARTLEVLLSSKAITFEVLNLRRVAADLAASDDEAAGTIRDLIMAQRALENFALRPPSDTSGEQVSEQRDALQEDLRRLEEQLSRKLAKFLGSEISFAASLDMLCAAMAPGAVHIEFFTFRPYNFKAVRETPRWQPAHYAAIVASQGARNLAQFVDLGPADEIDRLVEQLAEHIEQFKRLAGSWADEEQMEAEYRKAASALSTRLFAPLQAAIGDARQVTLGPDGRLHEIAFEALVDGSGRYLIEAGYHFAYVNSGRDLLRSRGELGAGVAVVAAPDYSLGFEQRAALAAKASLGSGKRLARSGPAVGRGAEPGAGLSRSAETRRGWRDLGEAALREGEQAAAAFARANFGDVAIFTRGLALEEVVKRLVSPRVLVLITHGDFLQNEPEPNRAAEGARSFLPMTVGRGGAGRARAGLRAVEDPFLRSYLVLAGANEIDEQIPPDVHIENGWLTAREIAQLDLRGTDLVVLSACSTNRGDVNNRQAVMGMRSAFLFAGARTIVGSLFEVPNVETRHLLEPFYEGVAAGRGKLAALNEAKLQFIRQRRATEGAAHPFYWASFILVGEP